VSHRLAPLARELAAGVVRYVVIGVGAANLYGPSGQAIFITKDNDLFLPLEPDNLVRAWDACERAALDLWLNDGPLDRPRGRCLARVRRLPGEDRPGHPGDRVRAGARLKPPAGS